MPALNFLSRTKPVSLLFKIILSLSLLTIFPAFTSELFADSGVKRLVHHIEITGDERTSKKTILRDLTFKVGDLIGDRDIEESRQNLMNRRLFVDVLIEEIPLEAEGMVKIRVVLKEKWSYLPLPQFTRTSDAEIRIGFSYEDFNFKGTASYIKIKWLKKWADDYDRYIGTDLSLRMKLRDFLKEDTTISLSRSSKNSLERTFVNGEEVSSYRESKDAYSIGLGWTFDKINAGISYSRGRHRYKWLGGLTQPYSEVDVSSIGISLGFDTVNNLGSYIYEGYSIRLNVGESNEAIGSDLDATTYSLDLKKFIPLGGRKNLAYRIRGAFIDGDTAEGQRLSVGGSSSLRGYKKGEYEGDRTLRLSSEYRFPLTAVYWGGVLFLDGANAWPEGEGVTAEDMKWGAGLGLRLFIKRLVNGVGRLDYAYNLSRHEYIAYAGVRHTF